MSTTSATTENLTIIEKLERYGQESLTAFEHGVLRLVGLVARSPASLLTLEESPLAGPLVKEAIAWSETAAAFYGIPVAQIENIGKAMIAAAIAFTEPPVLPPVPAAA